ncbi:MAG: glutamate--tRNA ligase, partial [Proteobacteria bacterium]|nr:glutamate--tRNA ligase [Pseudomonadota bacterium]
ETIRPNTVFPQDALTWATILFAPLTLSTEAEEVVAATGDAFLTAVETSVALSYADMVEAVKLDSGAKGKGLFMPLRLLMSGRHDGPEMAKMWQLIGREGILARLGQVMSVKAG